MFLYKLEKCFPSIGMLPRTLRIETSCFFYAGSLGLVRWKLGYRIICILTPRREKGIGRKTRTGGCNVSSYCSLSEDYGTASLEERCGWTQEAHPRRFLLLIPPLFYPFQMSCTPSRDRRIALTFMDSDKPHWATLVRGLPKEFIFTHR